MQGPYWVSFSDRTIAVPYARAFLSGGLQIPAREGFPSPPPPRGGELRRLPKGSPCLLACYGRRGRGGGEGLLWLRAARPPAALLASPCAGSSGERPLLRCGSQFLPSEVSKGRHVISMNGGGVRGGSGGRAPAACPGRRAGKGRERPRGLAVRCSVPAWGALACPPAGASMRFGLRGRRACGQRQRSSRPACLSGSPPPPPAAFCKGAPLRKARSR